MATGTIEKVISESGTTGIKLNDGFIMRWKQESFASGDYAKTVYWDNMFTTILTAFTSTDAVDVTTDVVISGNNSVTIARRPVATACTVRVLAIGRWK